MRNSEEPIKELSNSKKQIKGLYSIKKNEASFVRLPKEYGGSFKIKEEVFHETKKKFVKVTSICDNAFEDCSSLEHIHFPDSLKRIGDSAFAGCSALKEIELPQSLTSIGDNAFEGCSALNLKENKLPQSLTTIGNSAFNRCAALKEIILPQSLTSIGNYAFAWCAALKKIHYFFEGSPQTILWNSCSDEEKEKFLNLFKSNAISKDTFLEKENEENGKDKAKERIDGNKVIEIGENDFKREEYKKNNKCETIVISNDVKVIPSQAFEDFYSLREIEIPNSVNKISSFAFSDCSSLSRIVIPQSVVNIEEGAFDNCQELNQVLILGKKTILGFPLFESTGPGLALRLDSEYYCYSDNCIYSKDKRTLYEYINPGGEDIVIEINENTRRIWNRAFHNLKEVSKITIPEGLSIIGNNDEYDFSPVFDNCESVKEIHIKNQYPNNAKINENAFEKIPEDCEIHVPVGSAYSYRHHPAFKRFKNIIVEEPVIEI